MSEGHRASKARGSSCTSVSPFSILLTASRLPFLSQGPWKQGGKRSVSGHPRSGAQTQPRPSRSVTQHIRTVPHGLGTIEPRTLESKHWTDVCNAARCRIQSLPTGPSPALCLPFSHPLVLAGGNQFRQDFPRKVRGNSIPSLRKQPCSHSVQPVKPENHYRLQLPQNPEEVPVAFKTKGPKTRDRCTQERPRMGEKSTHGQALLQLA